MTDWKINRWQGVPGRLISSGQTPVSPGARVGEALPMADPRLHRPTFRALQGSLQPGEDK